jgi:ATP-dependent RNA/DNA helicase IGHMBP2
LIRQLVLRGNRVLAVAPSNIAVDNLAESLAATPPGQERPLRLLRVGHPARITPAVLENTLEAVTSRGDESLVVADIQKELQQHFAALSARDKKTGRFVASRQARRRVYKETKTLRKELRQWENKARSRAFGNADVVFATTVGVAGRAVRFNGEAPFDVVVIDEAAQALEAACWISILKATGGGRCVLAGDHCQLPPTITSDAARDAGLGTTLFDRLVNKAERRHQTSAEHALPTVENVPVCLLNVQYRMHEAISRWASREMYLGKLKAAPEVAKRKLSELPGVADRVRALVDGGHEDDDEEEQDDHTELTVELLDAPLVLVDTAGLSLDEVEDVESGSKANPGEALLVAAYLSRMIGDAGVHPADVAVISPYSAQVSLLKQTLEESDDAVGESWSSRGLEVRTVDGFQGREKELVVLSLVRSNLQKQVGFLADERRINVAVTRAKRQVVVICDSETAGANAFLARLLTHIEEEPTALSISALELVPSLCGEDEIAVSMAGGRFGESKANAATSATKARQGGAKSAAAKAARNAKRQAELGGFVRSLKERWENGASTENNSVEMGSSVEADGSFDAWAFPVSFSSFDRHVIHEMAEALHLGHESFGRQEDGTRYVVLSVAKTQEVSAAAAGQPDEFEYNDEALKHETSRSKVKEDEAVLMPSVSAAKVPPDAPPETPPKVVVPSQTRKPSTSPAPASANSMLSSLAQEREARRAARLAAANQRQLEMPALGVHAADKAISSKATPKNNSNNNNNNNNNNKKKKKKKKKKMMKAKQKASQESSKNTSDAAVVMDGLDEMAFLDAMVAENQAAAKKRDKPKNWVKAEAQRWRINTDGVLSGSRGGTLSARERNDKAKLLRNKIVTSQNGRGTSKAKKKSGGGARKKKK